MQKRKEKLKQLAIELLQSADVKINGNRPWDMQIHNEDFYARVLTQGPLGLAEAYMDEWWSAEKLDNCLEHLLRAKLDKKIKGDWRSLLLIAKQIIFNPQARNKSQEVADRHYDLGNDLYISMLDKNLVYSCGYWKKATSLDQAQIAKLDLICRKLNLQPGQTVLDIGCGWGSFAKHAAKKYGVKVVGVSNSSQQVMFAQRNCHGLDVEIQLNDYHEIEGMYDHIVSIGMFEHVGYKNYRNFMQIVAQHLKEGGLFLLHTIGQNDTTFTTDPWVTKYIFPNSMLPSIKQIGNAIENIFVMEDWHNFGIHYDRTLLCWQDNFVRHWPELKANYGERFYLMWNYYLLGSAATFRCRNNQLWQIVLSKNGEEGGYNPVR